MTTVSDIKRTALKLAFVITEHPVLGNLIEVYQVKLNEDGTFSLESSRVNIQDIRAGKFPLANGEEGIIELIHEYSEENLVKRFHKKPEKFSIFIKKLPKEVLEKNIRPFIDERIYKIIRQIISKGLKLYFKGPRKSYFTEKNIELPEEETKVLFHFRMAEEGIVYHQSIRYKEEVIDLYGKEAFFLMEKPVCLFLDQRIHLFETSLDYKKLLPFFSKQHILIPKSAINEYFSKFVFKVVAQHEVEAEGFEIEEVVVEPEAILELKLNWTGQYMLMLSFRYDKKILPYHYAAPSFVDLNRKDDSYVFRKFIRNRSVENEYYRNLTAFGLIDNGNSFFTLSSTSSGSRQSLSILLNWINNHSEDIRKSGFHFLQNPKGHKYFMEAIKIEKQVVSKTDWFDVHIEVHFGNTIVPFSHIIPYIMSCTREFPLPDGQIAFLPEEWFSDFRYLLLFANQIKGKLRIEKGLFDSGHIHMLIPGEKKQKLKELLAKPEHHLVEVPPAFKMQLRTYQQIGLSWMYHLGKKGFGCCLSDDMGLGKTAQVLALLLKESKLEDDSSVKNVTTTKGEGVQLNLFEDLPVRKRGTSLVVMPVSLIHNWVNEIHKFTPDLKYLVLEGLSRTKDYHSFAYYDLIITSYGIVRNDIDVLQNYLFDFVILDESQLIKNPDSKAYKAVIQLKGARKIVLTGTPVENSITDLWAQMNFINPDLLGNAHNFKNEYLIPIEKEGDEFKRSKLKSLIRPFILRRTKEEVEKDLPELTETIRYCEMTAEQQHFYEEKKSEIRNFLMERRGQAFPQKMILILKGLMTLRLASNHPFLTSYSYDHDSGKFNEIISSLEQLLEEKHKVLVFSSFTKHLELYASYLDEKQIPYTSLTGSTPNTQRKKVIADFQNNPDLRVFLLSIKAGGVGLNLTAADYVFLLDPWWNPAVEMQAFSRAHRIGQDKKVFVYKFITKNSIEEKILVLQEKKKLLAQEFINSNNPLKAMSEEEIEELFN